MVALGTFGASTKRKLTCELSPVCSLGGAEHIRTMHVVNKIKTAKSLIASLVSEIMAGKRKDRNTDRQI